ncbi:MAG: histone deacetylase family protein [Candidatus Thorarchaeota archaeon]|nr:histone deacetylase family protein [Candidatus Thorarchaeota archaeon]
MKIVYHPLMLQPYDSTPAGAPGRLESAVEMLSKTPGYEFLTPEPATDEQILRAHGQNHLESVKSDSDFMRGGLLYEMASLAAGGAILTGHIAAKGEPAFGLIRPPGHHASRNSYWGFCYHNNIAISLLDLEEQGIIKSAFILDFDLHTGDGNIDILGDRAGYVILNPRSQRDNAYLAEVREALDAAPDVDIMVASAGFDQYEDDWGGNLSTHAFREIGRMMNDFAKERCEGRCYGLLEGGYNFQDLGKNVHAFCEGLQGK